MIKVFLLIIEELSDLRYGSSFHVGATIDLLLSFGILSVNVIGFLIGSAGV